MIGFLALRLLSPNRIAGAAPAASAVAPAAVVAVCFRKSLRFIPSSRERSSPLHLLLLPFHKQRAASCRAVPKEPQNSFTTSRQGTAKARKPFDAKARRRRKTRNPAESIKKAGAQIADSGRRRSFPLAESRRSRCCWSSPASERRNGPGKEKLTARGLEARHG